MSRGRQRARPRPPQPSCPPRPRRAALRATALIACLACGAQPALVQLRAAPERAPTNGGAWADAARAAASAHAEASSLVLAAGAGELLATELLPNLDAVERWRVRAEVRGTPALAAERVLYVERGRIVALDARDGARRWALDARDASLLAAAASANRTALLSSDRAGRRSIAICDDSGRERLRVVADAVLGAPTLLGSLLLAPFGDGNVAAIDVESGAERGRARLGVRALDALLTPDGLFFGGPPWLRLDGGAPYALPRRPLPGPLASGSEPPSPGHDVTRLHVRPTRAASPAAGDIYMASYGRIVLGLEREHGNLVWVAAVPGRVLAAENVGSGLLVCDESGGLRLFAAHTGGLVREWRLVQPPRQSLGEAALVACALGPASRLESDAPPTAEPPPLLEQLARVLALSAPGMSDAQRFLARELAARPEPEATRVLIELITRRSLDRVLQSEAEDLLAIRRNGQDYMLAALSGGEHAADATALPPIAALGEALAALGERRAAPLLARQLNRPAHAAAALTRAAAALEPLASEAEYHELSVFFSLHRTTADSPELMSAVISVGTTLLRVGGPKARSLITRATQDPLTVAEVRTALERALGATSPSEPPSSSG
ncbi:MAG TPA: PQQ-binding-like beta-propeller repeat protein [Polyangiaceae bacterium]|nr:PQQ-binding-like beta-propeller repeat protein [Polyangiaceae bacterium]